MWGQAGLVQPEGKKAWGSPDSSFPKYINRLSRLSQACIVRGWETTDLSEIKQLSTGYENKLFFSGEESKALEQIAGRGDVFYICEGFQDVYG